MKKLIALFLSLLVIMLQSVNVFAWTLSDEDGNVIGNQAPETEQEADVEYETWDILEFMYAIGAFDENTISYSMLDEKIDKISFISAVAEIYFCKDSSVGIPEQIFSDIPENHYAAADVSRLASMGMINGKGDGTLGAEDDVSLDTAYAIVIRMLGYGQYAEALGGYPKGSNDTARKLDITVDIQEPSAITAREAVQLLYNALDAELFSFTGADGNKYNYEPGETLLENKINITKKRGIVYASGAASVSGKAVGDNSTLIGSEVLYDPEGYSLEYLGYNTEYFTSEDGELLFVMPYKTAAITIDTSEDISYKDGYLYHGVDKVKKERISVDEISILYNGVAASSINELVPAYGEVKLIDNDRDNVYEVAVVDDYDVYYLSSMSKDKSELRLEYGTETVVKKLDDYDNISLFDETGEEISSLKAKSVVMVAENGSSIKVIQCKKNVSGKITAITNDDTKKYWTVGNELLKSAETVYYDGWDGKTLQKKINVYLDKYGNIAAVFADESASSAEEWKLGWLVQIIQDDTDENAFLAKIIDTEYSEELIYQFSEKFKVDGVQKSLKKGYDPKNAISERGVVRYLISGGELKALDFPENKPFSDVTKVADNEFDKLYLRISGQRYYVESQGTLVKNSASLEGDGNVYFSSGSVIYDAPERSSAMMAKSDEIMVIERSAFTDHNYYEIDAYSVGSENGYTDAAVVYGHNLSGGKTGTVGAAMVITEIKTGLDEEDMPADIVSGYVMGSKEEYMISYDGLTPDSLTYGNVTSFSSLNQGDIIKFTTDRYGRIDWIQKIWSEDGTGYINKYGWTKEDIFGIYRYVKADVLSFKDGVIAYMVPNGNFEMNRIGGAPVFVYDRSAKGSDAYKAASSADIELATNAGIYEAVLVSSYHTLTKEVILIKK